MLFQCDNHKVTLTLDGNNRTLAGQVIGGRQCALFTAMAKDLENLKVGDEITVGQCPIKRLPQ